MGLRCLGDGTLVTNREVVFDGLYCSVKHMSKEETLC